MNERATVASVRDVPSNETSGFTPAARSTTSLDPRDDRDGISTTNTSTTTAQPASYRWQRRNDPAAIKGMTTRAFMNRLIDTGAYKPWGDPFAARFTAQVKNIYMHHGKPVGSYGLVSVFGHSQREWRDTTVAGQDINRLNIEMGRRGGPRQAGLRNVLKGFNVGDMNRLRSAMMGTMTPNELRAFQGTMLQTK